MNLMSPERLYNILLEPRGICVQAYPYRVWIQPKKLPFNPPEIRKLLTLCVADFIKNHSHNYKHLNLCKK